MCSTAERWTDIETAKELMLMLGLSEAIDLLSVASSVHWCGHVLWREDGHVLRREDGHALRREDGHVLRREDGHVLRREDGHVLRREDGHVWRREDGHVLMREDGHVLRREDDHVLRREDGHVLLRALEFRVEGQQMKGRIKRTLKKPGEEESMKVGLSREDGRGGKFEGWFEQGRW